LPPRLGRPCLETGRVASVYLTAGSVSAGRRVCYHVRRGSPDVNPEAAVLSARNQFKGTIKSVKLGNVMAEVVVTAGGLEIVSAITRRSAEAMNLKPGDAVTAVIKSTEVLIGKD
jgi:molybdopterin-binding protein